MDTVTKGQPEAQSTSLEAKGGGRRRRGTRPAPREATCPGAPLSPTSSTPSNCSAGVGFGLVIALGVSVEGHAALASAGGWPLAIARVSAFAGSYLLLVMVVLTARLPWLERTVGQDTLVRWHRKIAPYAVSLISLHVLSVILGLQPDAQDQRVSHALELLGQLPRHAERLGRLRPVVDGGVHARFASRAPR